MREFLAGAALLLDGFRWWRTRPGMMALGLLPALVSSILLGTALTVLATQLPAIATATTPFADGWPGLWSALVRIAVGAAVFGAALVVSAMTFTALTLLLGEPVYDRIWRVAERELTGTVPDADPGIRQAVGDAVALLVRGALTGVVTFLVGLVPGVGGSLAAVVGVFLGGRVLAEELSSRALAARGIPRVDRRALLRARRLRTLGFGVATQLCFLVPLGAIAVMPAAVVGSTRLAVSALPAVPLTPSDRPRTDPTSDPTSDSASNSTPDPQSERGPS